MNIYTYILIGVAGIFTPLSLSVCESFVAGKLSGASFPLSLPHAAQNKLLHVLGAQWMVFEWM